MIGQPAAVPARLDPQQRFAPKHERVRVAAAREINRKPPALSTAASSDSLCCDFRGDVPTGKLPDARAAPQCRETEGVWAIAHAFYTNGSTGGHLDACAPVPAQWHAVLLRATATPRTSQDLGCAALALSYGAMESCVPVQSRWSSNALTD